MRTKQTTEISVFHTPDKTSKPDLKHQSHLKTTVPSVYELSPSPQRTSQFGIHHSKMKNYQATFGVSTAPQTEKRASKNPWELKEKVDEYESQIALLRQYLQSSQCRCIQKGSISRIFGFPQQKDSLSREQQRVIKQLGNKVKGLVRENANLKQQNAHYSQLNIEEIISQNEKLQQLLDNYKKSAAEGNIGPFNSNNINRLIQQNELLKDELYRTKLANDQKLRHLERQHDSKIKQFRNKQLQLLNKIRQLQLQSQQQQRVLSNKNSRVQLNALEKIQEIQSTHTKNLIEQQLFYKQQLEEQQVYYQKQKESLENQLIAVEDKLKQQLENGRNLEQQLNKSTQKNQQQLEKLKQFYANTIEDIQAKNNDRLNQLTKLLQLLQQRVQQTDKSIEHLKFQRNNRIQSTIKKSHNLAISSSKPKGQLLSQQPLMQQNLQEQVNIDKKPLNYLLQSKQSKLATHHVDVLKEKVNYLQREIQQLNIKLGLNEKMNIQKTQKIIGLENQIKNLNNIISNLNYNLAQVKNQVQVKEIVKQVPIPVTIPTIPKQYSQQVKNIKQTIISCNLSNFDIFQNQIHQIIQQRNQLNQKMMTLKKQAKQSSKILILEKHLKVERERNKLLEENLKKYQKEIENLKIQVIQLKSEIQCIQQQSPTGGHIDGRQMEGEENRVSFEHLPDGRAGLEWQKVVKHCLMTSINRLQNLQNRMRQDISGQNTQ